MYILVRNEDGKIESLESWGASTKHPDSVFYFKDFECSPYVKDRNSYWNVYQWILECASKLAFPYHSYGMVKFANEFLEKTVAEACHQTQEEARNDLGILSMA